MCLYIVKGVRKSGKYVYKVLEVKNEKLISPYQGFEYKPGWIISDRAGELGKQFVTQPTDNEKRCNEIENGIHVFHNPKDADKHEGYDNSVVVRLEVNEKDLVARGKYGDANNSVYNKVFLSKAEYDRVIKKSKNKKMVIVLDDLPF